MPIPLPLIVAALFYGLASDCEPWIPSFSDRRERELVRKTKRPVALFKGIAHRLPDLTGVPDWGVTANK